MNYFQTAAKTNGTPNGTGSQVSIASTPGNSITSTDHTCSSDWPEPPEQPICSTEDEAGSLFTDSGMLIQNWKIILWNFENLELLSWLHL